MVSVSGGGDGQGREPSCTKDRNGNSTVVHIALAQSIFGKGMERMGVFGEKCRPQGGRKVADLRG